MDGQIRSIDDMATSTSPSCRLDAATARGIAVCNVPDYCTESFSDHAIGMTLAAARGIPRLDRGVRARSFDIAAVRPLY